MTVATGEQALASDVNALKSFEVVNSETRDLTAAAGDVAYTSYGFQPTALIIFAYGNGAMSWGIADGTTDLCLSWRSDATAGPHAWLIENDQTANNARAVLKSFDADGFTLTWTKTNTPTGTLTMQVLAIRQGVI